jgi:hypothetical protein
MLAHSKRQCTGRRPLQLDDELKAKSEGRLEQLTIEMQVQTPWAMPLPPFHHHLLLTIPNCLVGTRAVAPPRRDKMAEQAAHAFQGADTVFCTLGTTRKDAGSAAQ